MRTRPESWVSKLADAAAAADIPRRDLLRAWVVALLVCGVAFRAWSITRSWFYSDDFILLEDAHEVPLSLDYIFSPHDSHLMPWGRAIVWATAQAEPFTWWPAAVSTVVLLVAAAASCAWMLIDVFGWRWRVLVPLAFYLFTPLTIDSVVWWAAALNALPMHIGFFLTVGFGMRYARTGSTRSLVAALTAFTIGLAGDPRALQVAPTLALAVVLFLAPRGSSIAQRVLYRWRLPAGLFVISCLYLVLYRATTPSPVTPAADIYPWETLGNALGRSWVTGLFGGPWTYDNRNPPAGFVDPPLVLNILAGLALAAVVLLAVRHVPATTAKVCTIMGVHLTVTMVGLVLGRATQIGPVAGLLMRFLGDTALTATVALALLLMRPRGGTGRELPLPRGRGKDALTAVGALVVAGSVVTAVNYSLAWTSYPARSFVTTVAQQTLREPAVVAEVAVPELVQPRLAYPYNLPSRLLAPLGPALRGVTHGNDLEVLDRDGVPRQAVVAPVVNAPPGPQEGCGYAVGPEPVTITLTEPNRAVFWWLSISYLSAESGRLAVAVDDRPLTDIEVLPGVHSWFVQGDSAFETIELRSTTDSTVCIDSIALDGKIGPIR